MLFSSLVLVLDRNDDLTRFLYVLFFFFVEESFSCCFHVLTERVVIKKTCNSLKEKSLHFFSPKITSI